MQSKRLVKLLISSIFLGILSIRVTLLRISPAYADDPNEHLNCLIERILNPSLNCNPVTPEAGVPVFKGSWQSRQQSPETIFLNIEDDGQNIRGNVYTANFDHAIEGIHNNINRATVTIYRSNINTVCTTRMYGIFTYLPPNTIRVEITGTDGRCDLPSDYKSIIIYDKR